jgi:hypothetical protein
MITTDTKSGALELGVPYSIPLEVTKRKGLIDSTVRVEIQNSCDKRPPRHSRCEQKFFTVLHQDARSPGRKRNEP